MNTGNAPSKNRLEWIDLVRIFAIFLVVLCHAIEGGVYNFNIYVFADIHILSRIFGFASFTFSRLASCLFLIMSGYLLLDRDYDKDKILRFWKKSWLHLLICTVIWFFIYDIILMAYYHWEYSFLTILYDLIFFHEVKMMNAWYMLCGYLAKRGLFKPVKTGWLIAVVICCIKHAKFLKELASYSFAVYLVHVIIRLLLLEWILSLPIIRPVKVIIFWLITLALSYAAAWPISKIPKIGNYLNIGNKLFTIIPFTTYN